MINTSLTKSSYLSNNQFKNVKILFEKFSNKLNFNTSKLNGGKGSETPICLPGRSDRQDKSAISATTFSFFLFQKRQPF
jgi:hypothetical protein